MRIRGFLKRQVLKACGWAKDTIGASYYPTTQRRHDDRRGDADVKIIHSKEGPLRDYHAVAKTRGGTTWLRGEPKEPGAEPLWDVPLSDRESRIWYTPSRYNAQQEANGFNRALSARRRTIVFLIGIGVTIGLAYFERGIFGCS